MQMESHRSGERVDRLLRKWRELTKVSFAARKFSHKGRGKRRIGGQGVQKKKRDLGAEGWSLLGRNGDQERPSRGMVAASAQREEAAIT